MVRRAYFGDTVQEKWIDSFRTGCYVRGMSTPDRLSRVISGCVLLTMLLLPSAVYAGLYEANLLSNPSFEDYYTGSGPNWSSGASVQYDVQLSNTLSRGAQAWLNAGDDVASIRSDGAATGQTGAFFGTGGESGATLGVVSRLRQDIDLLACGFTVAELDSGSLYMQAGAWLSSYASDPDTVEVRVTYLDVAANEFALAWSSGPRDVDTWTRYESAWIVLSPGTRRIRFDVEFVKLAGTQSDGHIDDAWVFLAPAAPPVEPMLDRNLVCNPSFETGTRGWATLAGNPRARQANLDGVPANSGQTLLFGGQRPLAGASNRAAAAQVITLANYGFTAAVLAQTDRLLFLQFSCWLYGYDNYGQAKVRLEILDENGIELTAYDTGRVRMPKIPSPFRWQIALPPAARSLKLTYDAVDPGGTNLDGYLDDVSVILTRRPHRPARTGPIVVGHRGNSIVAPENTISSETMAKRVAQYGELDAYVCASGELVVMHDGTVDRTTDGTGSITALSLAQLGTLDAGSWFSTDFIGEPVPTLEAMINAMLPEVIPLIERKGGSAEVYVNELHRMGVEHDVVVQSFDWQFLAQLHQLDPTISLGALLSGDITAANALQAKQAGVWFIAQSQGNVNATGIALAHTQGLQVVAWTVNSAAAAENFIAMGVDGIITDHPAMITWNYDLAASPADFDGDGDVDQTDLAFFGFCRTGPQMSWTDMDCELADLDADGDVDQADFGIFQRSLTGL